LSDLIKSENKIELSNDINVITAEIESYKQMAGLAIFEIGRRLKYVKENNLTHGEFGKWLKENIDMTWQTANKFMKVYERFGNCSPGSNLNDLGIAKLYLLSNFTDEELEDTKILPDGETKKLLEMSKIEIEQYKKTLKELQNRTKKIEIELEQEKNKNPVIQEKEVIPEDIKIKLKLNFLCLLTYKFNFLIFMPY
jgi:hypothetical protein